MHQLFPRRAGFDVSFYTIGCKKTVNILNSLYNKTDMNSVMKMGGENLTKILLSLSEGFANEKQMLEKELGKLGATVTSITTKKESITEYLHDTEIIVTGLERIDRSVIEKAPNLKYVSKFGSGIDNIDLVAASERGVLVTNTPGQNASSVADLTLGLMLAVSRNLTKSNEIVKTGNWQLHIGNEIEGKRLGIIGFGEIGKKVAKRATGFDMNIVAFANYQDEEKAQRLGVQFVSLEELLTTSDYVVLSTSLKKSTYHLMNEQRLAFMKNSAYLINIARGDLIDEKALIRCLKAGKIKGAALDVFSKEPPELELVELDNVVCSSHIGGATEECAARIGNMVLQNLKNYLQNGDLIHKVTKND